MHNEMVEHQTFRDPMLSVSVCYILVCLFDLICVVGTECNHRVPVACFEVVADRTARLHLQETIQRDRSPELVEVFQRAEFHQFH